ncbi:MAG: SDR family oxidoreductase [Chloroflexi bacterium]|nr:SDR family oxidoreductase [Chloroflexota bacterium]
MNEQGRVAVVTGSARGIGLATASLLRERGLRVAIVDSDLEAAKEAAVGLDPRGDTVSAVQVDVLDADSVTAMVEEVVSRFGGVDVLVNNAGITSQGPSQDVTDEAWDRLLGIHVGGTFRCSRAAFPALAASGGGAIVNLASIAARVGLPQRLSYCTAKAGIEGMTRTLAVEWAPHGIRVNAVAPGWTRTRLVDDTIKRGLINEARLNALIPLGRLAKPEEIAAAIAFLASSEASYITGQTLYIDGGVTIQLPV